MSEPSEGFGLVCAVCGHDLSEHDRAHPWPCANEGCGCVAFRVDTSDMPEPSLEQATAWMATIERLPTGVWTITPTMMSPGFYTCIQKTPADDGSIKVEIGPAYGTLDAVRGWLNTHHQGWESTTF